MSGTAHAVPTGNTFDKYGSTNPLVRRLMAGFERTLAIDRQEAAGEGGRHAAGAGDRCHQRVAVCDGHHRVPVRDVVDRPGDPFIAMRRLLTENHEPRKRQLQHIREAVGIAHRPRGARLQPLD